jgi:hypothetical protein
MKYYTINCHDLMYIVKAKNLRVARRTAFGRYGKTSVKDVHESTGVELDWFLSMSGVSSLDEIEVIGDGI